MALIGGGPRGGKKGMRQLTGKQFKMGGSTRSGTTRQATITPNTFKKGYSGSKGSSGMAKHMAKLGKTGA